MRFSARLFCFALIAGAAVAEDEPVRLILLHTNDIHGQLEPMPAARGGGVLRGKDAGGFAHLAAMVRGIRREAAASGAHVLLLDGGDIYQGTPIGNESKGASVVDAMNALGYDAGALGNHEFDFGRENLDALLERARFPVLACNMSGLDAVKPYVVIGKPRLPLRVAVIGMITPATPGITARGATKGLRFSDPAPAVRALVKEVEADLFVVVSHVGREGELALAADVPGLAAVLGGHSHTPYVQQVGRTMVIQTHTRALSLARVDLELDPKTWAVRDVKGDLLRVDPAATEPDPVVQEVIARYARSLDKRLGEAVGTITAPLARGPERHRSCSAGNWMADVLRAAGEAEIGFMNKGGIRTELDAGKLTREDLYRLMPFENDVTAMDLSGADVRALIERHFTTVGALDWSGLAVDVEPRGERYRLVAVTVGGAPLDPERTYRVATNSYLASGGDGYAIFRKGENVTHGALMRDALADALAAASPLTPPEEQRQRILEKAR
jgi:2',3'-cyclic-nucleotide 2'-phosphodiesterase (5'-nucleotidase family)